MMDELFIDIIEILGTAAFAISGIRLAAAKRFDWFGAYVVGLVTAIGGGTLRDVLLDLPVFWMKSSVYLVVTFISLVAVIVFRQALVKGMRTLFIFDAIGLALFVVVGVQRTTEAGLVARKHKSADFKLRYAERRVRYAPHHGKLQEKTYTESCRKTHDLAIISVARAQHVAHQRHCAADSMCSRCDRTACGCRALRLGTPNT